MNSFSKSIDNILFTDSLKFFLLSKLIIFENFLEKSKLYLNNSEFWGIFFSKSLIIFLLSFLSTKSPTFVNKLLISATESSVSNNLISSLLSIFI